MTAYRFDEKGQRVEVAYNPRVTNWTDKSGEDVEYKIEVDLEPFDGKYRYRVLAYWRYYTPLSTDLEGRLNGFWHEMGITGSASNSKEAFAEAYQLYIETYR